MAFITNVCVVGSLLSWIEIQRRTRTRTSESDAVSQPVSDLGAAENVLMYHP
jgi:hypothetical protein